MNFDDQKRELLDKYKNESGRKPIPVPIGFIELHPIDSESVWHIQVDEIADYGPESYLVGGDLGELMRCCPVRLRGQPRAELRNVREGLRQIAALCVEAQKRISYDVKQRTL